MFFNLFVSLIKLDILCIVRYFASCSVIVAEPRFNVLAKANLSHLSRKWSADSSSPHKHSGESMCFNLNSCLFNSTCPVMHFTNVLRWCLLHLNIFSLACCSTTG